MVIGMVIKMWYVYVILVTLTHMGYCDSASQKIVLSKKVVFEFVSKLKLEVVVHGVDHKRLNTVKITL